MRAKTLEELGQLVIQWAENSGLFEHPSPYQLTAQFRDTVAGIAKLEQSIEDRDIENIKYAIGDIIVSLLIRHELLCRLDRTSPRIDLFSRMNNLSAIYESHRFHNLHAEAANLFIDPYAQGTYVLVILDNESFDLAGTDLRTCLELTYNKLTSENKKR